MYPDDDRNHPSLRDCRAGAGPIWRSASGDDIQYGHSDTDVNGLRESLSTALEMVETEARR